MAKNITINTRILDNHITGVQRYTIELLSRFQQQVNIIKPAHPLSGISGHFWEQFILPQKVGTHLLWSPSNTGPLSIKRQVVTMHDVVPLDHPEWLNNNFATWYRFLTPRLMRRAAKIITDSNFSRMRILANVDIPEEKIAVIYIGADERFQPYGVGDIHKAITELKLPSKHYVLTVGSLEPRKNLSRLLKAWNVVLPHMPDEMFLVLTGALGKKQVFGELSLDSLPPRVHFTGHVRDELLPALYSGATAFAYVSLYEGFGLPPLEAMACGTPVLTSNVTSIPEVVGDAALTVDPHDVEAIADGLRRLVSDSSLRENLRSKGLERAKLFSWDKTAQETWKVLDEAAHTV